MDKLIIGAKEHNSKINLNSHQKLDSFDGNSNTENLSLTKSHINLTTFHKEKFCTNDFNNESIELLHKNDTSNSIYDELIKFENEKKLIHKKVMNNMNSYRKKGAKIDYEMLFDIAINFPKEKRTKYSIIQQYNTLMNDKKLSYGHLSKIITKS